MPFDEIVSLEPHHASPYPVSNYENKVCDNLSSSSFFFYSFLFILLLGNNLLQELYHHMNTEGSFLRILLSSQ